MASILIEHGTLTPGFIQFIVALTTLLMVIRFGLDALRHRSRGNIIQIVLATLDTVTHTMITYSLGIMQHRSATNSYYQLWAVLLVTLRYSVKIGRPAGIAMKQTPLVDLMSSFWAAHILRSHNVSMLLKVPGWLLWSINSARIIHGFISWGDANSVHRENMRLLTDYMRHEHTVGSGQRSDDPTSMKGYRYLVLGETNKLKKREAGQAIDEVETTETINRLLMALAEDDKELITLERIWSHQGRRSSQNCCQCNLPPGCCGILDQKTKDLCLSFALYKLLRRRFFNFPIHEARLQKTRRLVIDGILGEGDAANYERAFRVSEAEVAFLNDFFNSRYAIIFAQGFPWIRLVLSTLLIGGISSMAVAVHRFSKAAKEDELGRVHIHHGVYFTWVILSLLGAKEIWEMTTYVFSDWTKVLLLGKYIEQPWWLRGCMGSMPRTLIRILLCSPPIFKRWHGKVDQFNLLFSRDSDGELRSKFSIHLSQQVKKAVVDSLKNSLSKNIARPLENYLVEAVNKNLLSQELARPLDNPEQVVNGEADGRNCIREKMVEINLGLQDDVHRLLVWHIATCYCEIELAETRNFRVSVWSNGRGLAAQSRSDFDKPWWPHYLVARTLSQYCCYLLRLVPPLSPGNGLVVKAVFRQVYKEKNCLVRGKHHSLPRCTSSTQILDRLKRYGRGEIGLDVDEDGNIDTILKKGAVLGETLTKTTTNIGSEALWKFLSEFWAGFVVHLAASTKASQHKMYLTAGGELMTHLWALLSHAGYLGATAHGDQTFDTVLQQHQPYDQNMQA